LASMPFYYVVKNFLAVAKDQADWFYLHDFFEIYKNSGEYLVSAFSVLSNCLNVIRRDRMKFKITPIIYWLLLFSFGLILIQAGVVNAQKSEAQKEYEAKMKKWRADSIKLAQKKAAANKAADSATKKKKSYNDGNTYYRKGQYQQALASYQKAVQLDSKYSKAYYGLGNALKKLRKYDESVKSYQTAISIDSTNVKYIYSLGTLYRMQENYKQAIKTYQKAIVVNANYYRAYYEMAYAYNKLNNHPKALEALNKAVEIKPDYDQAFNLMGRINITIAKYDDAIKAFQEAIAIKKKYDYYVFLAHSLNQKGDYQAVITAAQQASKLKSSGGQAHFEAGDAYKSLGRVQDAVASFKKASKDRRWRQSANYEIKILQEKK